MRVGIIGSIPRVLLDAVSIGIEIEDGRVVRVVSVEKVVDYVPEPAPMMAICREAPGEPVEKHPDVTGVYDRKRKRW